LNVGGEGNFAPPPNVAVDRRADDPYSRLKTHLAGFAGATLLIAESLGRRETLANALAEYGLRPELAEGWPFLPSPSGARGEFGKHCFPPSQPAGGATPAVGRGAGAGGEGETSALATASPSPYPLPGLRPPHPTLSQGERDLLNVVGEGRKPSLRAPLFEGERLPSPSGRRVGDEGERQLNRHAEVTGGVLAGECGGMVSGLFADGRGRVVAGGGGVGVSPSPPAPLPGLRPPHPTLSQGERDLLNVVGEGRKPSLRAPLFEGERLPSPSGRRVGDEGERQLNRHAEVTGGVLAGECGGMVSGLFADGRGRVVAGGGGVGVSPSPPAPLPGLRPPHPTLSQGERDLLNVVGEGRKPSPSSPTLLPEGEGGASPSPSGRGVRGEGERVTERERWHRLPPDLLGFARKLRTGQTDAERLLWYCLRNRRLKGYKFRRQHAVSPYVLDFYCEELKLGIELDGGQHLERQAEDARRSGFLAEQGIRVLRFWNDQVLVETEAVLEAIWHVLPEAQSGAVPGDAFSLTPDPSPGASPPLTLPSPGGRGTSRIGGRGECLLPSPSGRRVGDEGGE